MISDFLQDGTFSFEDFATTFEEYDVQRVIRSYENSISIHVHCCEEGEWKQVRTEFLFIILLFLESSNKNEIFLL